MRYRGSWLASITDPSNDITKLFYGTLYGFIPTTAISDPYVRVKDVKVGTQKAGQY